MVSSAATTVDEYMSEIPEPRRSALERIRSLCLQELAGFEEAIAYGMPAYSREGYGGIAFANQKQYISLYVLRTDVTAAFAERLAGHDMGKGCLRFRKVESIDYALVRDLLAATAASPGVDC